MAIDRDAFLAVTAGKFGRDLLKQYRKRLQIPYGADHEEPPTNDSLYKFAQNLLRDIESGRFTPGIPQSYVVLNKHQGVPRILPVFDFSNALVYYFCVYSIQDELAVGKVEGTFGGWHSSNALRKREKRAAPSDGKVEPEYIPYASVNKQAWSMHWQDFQREAFAVSRNSENPYVVKYDVANFYDSINLRLLEKRIRHRCDPRHEETINLLFAFLNHWNRKIEGFSPKQMGLPMDVEGEASRILANFYLQEHDAAISTFVEDELNGRFLRYSDDMMILVPDEANRNLELVKSAIELHRIGLSINSGKVYQFNSLAEYDYYWGFELFRLIGDGFDSTDLAEAVDQFLCRVNDESSNRKPWRQASVLKRLVRIQPNQFSDVHRREVARIASCSDNLSTMTAFHIKKIHDLLDADQKEPFVISLYDLAKTSAHTQLLFHMREFLSNLTPTSRIDLINKRIEELSDLYRLN